MVIKHFTQFAWFAMFEKIVNKVNCYNFLLFALCSLLIFFSGCASLSHKEKILAIVNSEPIVEDDLEYSLRIIHRREDLSSAKELDLSKFIQKLVDDRLIIQEARSMGMEDYPEVKQAIEKYIVRESVVRLYKEEITDKVSVTGKDIKEYYLKIKGQEVSDEELEKIRENVKKNIRKQKEKERGDEYLNYLKERQTIKIDQELLSSIKNNEEIDESVEERILAEVNGFSLTIKDFLTLVKSYPKRSKEEILNEWIDRKVIDSEALKRRYELRKDLKDMVERYKGQILKKTFINRIIMPQINITDELLKEYYSSHKEDFIKPSLFKIQQITVKTKEDAEDILKSLQNGADFSWLAEKRSVDSLAKEKGNTAWLTKTEMNKSVKEIVETLKPGDISHVIEVDSQYKIIKLLGRKEGEVEEFEKVKNTVYRMAFEEKVNKLLDDYVSLLKKDADITINERAIKALENKIRK